jgi:hypothetical protein
MIDALIKRVSVTYACYEMYAHRGKKCIKSVQQCTYFLFSVNLLLVGVIYGQRTMQVCS